MSKRKSGWPKGKEIRQILLHYVDVGNLSPFKADAFIDRCKDMMRDIIEQLQEQGVALITIPVRPGCATRMEVMPLIESDSSFDVEPQSMVEWSEISKPQCEESNPPQDDHPDEDHKRWFQEFKKSVQDEHIKVTLDEEELTLDVKIAEEE